MINGQISIDQTQNNYYKRKMGNSFHWIEPEKPAQLYAWYMFMMSVIWLSGLLNSMWLESGNWLNVAGSLFNSMHTHYTVNDHLHWFLRTSTCGIDNNRFWVDRILIQFFHTARPLRRNERKWNTTVKCIYYLIRLKNLNEIKLNLSYEMVLISGYSVNRYIIILYFVDCSCVFIIKLVLDLEAIWKFSIPPAANSLWPKLKPVIPK